MAHFFPYLEPSQFIFGPINITNYTRGSVILSCQASGIPLPLINWFKDGVMVEGGDDRINITTVSSVTQNERNITSYISINPLLVDDTGYYYCSTSNGAATGSAVFTDRTESAFLFVQCK